MRLLRTRPIIEPAARIVGGCALVLLVQMSLLPLLGQRFTVAEHLRILAAFAAASALPPLAKRLVRAALAGLPRKATPPFLVPRGGAGQMYTAWKSATGRVVEQA